MVLFSLFACREVEASLRLVKQVKIDSGAGCGKVSLLLPASKTDPKGDGVLRQLGCSCKNCPELCPAISAKALLKLAEEHGHGPEDPLLVCPDKKAPNKTAMVKAFRYVARAAGYTESYANQITGHALRPSGAQHMARPGVEYYKIQLFCRWGSDTILRYLREVPMEDSDQWMNETQQRQPSLVEIVEQVSQKVPADKGVNREQVLEIVTEALSTRSNEVLTEVNEAQDEINAVIKELNLKSSEMSEQWATELSRSFLPRYLINRTSNKVHAIKDAYTTGCGFEFRLSKDCEFKTTPPDGTRCETAGCAKLFDLWK